MNYFELFDCPVSFDLDKSELTQRYHSLQKQCHPDKHANASEQEKLAIVQKAAQINDAFDTLKTPIKRAEYMLQLRGIDMQHETKTLQDPMFLMQQMEYRERLEDIKTSDNALDELMAFEDDVATERKAMLKQLQTQIEQLTEQADLAAADQIRKLKFIEKLQQELSRLEDELVEY
ncbi:co-chaperone HscB [Catenovulum sp. SM1970]|uniref:co-chaperone HscB n=1 Tax=Marinifaba aquimaris TaxID=2741323 RepID=UPI0015744881|nr:co-chaperone HscB [Marinifaba aquimaris]NTS75455.1 co-chaperone HscB [Marinifaba aquimaris]